MNISPPTNRLDYLDAARAFALILGIIFHASISFMPLFIGWAVMDLSTSSIVPTFMLISHSFRMGLFFLIAGFFSHMSFHREGVQTFMKSRLVRIAIPFIIGWVLLRPMLVSGWIMGAESMRGEVNILNALKAGLASLEPVNGTLPKDLFIGTHLWFLYYLLLISFSVFFMRYFIGLHKPTQHKLTQIADSSIHWVCHSRLAIFVIAIPTAACLWFMNNWGMDTPDKTLTPHVPILLIYSIFFLFGWLLNRHAFLLEQFAQLTWGKFIFCLLAVIGTVLLSNGQMNFGHPQYILLKIGFALCYAIMMWSLISLTIGLFRSLFNRPSKTIRYLADSSYWLYLIHLPIVIWLQIALAETPIHWSIKLVTISGLTLFISLVLYDLLIRATFIGIVLNGKRKKRFLFYPEKPK